MISPCHYYSSSSSSLDPGQSRLLSLPPELRLQIYTHLLPPPILDDLTLRSIFLRRYFRTTFMTTTAGTKTTTQSLSALFSRPVSPSSLLTVCKGLTSELLPILYGLPMWRCAFRMEELGSQIGFDNFGLIKRMEVGFEDLGTVVESLSRDLNLMNGSTAKVGKEKEDQMEGEEVVEEMTEARLRFTNLEEMQMDGYQYEAFLDHTSGDSPNQNPSHGHGHGYVGGDGDGGGGICSSRMESRRRARLEAWKICQLARSLLQSHSKLNVVVQKIVKNHDAEGSDAVESGLGRVKWRFLVSGGMRKDDEAIVDLDELLRALQELNESDEKLRNVSATTQSLPRWRADGEFVQYPYLQAI